MSDMATTPPIWVGKGLVQAAVYQDSGVPSYRNNPLIEALPAILPAKEIARQLARYPAYDRKQCQLPTHVRLHVIQEALQLFVPLSVHLDLEQRVSQMIRSGYEARNPVSHGFWPSLADRMDALQPSGRGLRQFRSTANGFTIIGISGVGKTTAVEAILSLYPQVIEHREYRGRMFTHRQLVWIKLECPFDGSVKGLCLNFLQAVDDCLDTTYYRNYGVRRRTLDELLPIIARVASLHSLGVLVIDEIQHLSEAKSGGSDRMLNFFVQLINTIGLPVVLVGTYKAMAVLSGEFRQVRRASGQGDLVWDRMQETEDWQFFAESLWRYQFVQRPVPFSSELAHVLYEESQGITDLAVKMFMLSQRRAIMAGVETLNTSLIRSVAQDSFRLAAPALEALRNGDTRVLYRMNDVWPVDTASWLGRNDDASCSSDIGDQSGSGPSPPPAHPTLPQAGRAVSDTDSVDSERRTVESGPLVQKGVHFTTPGIEIQGQVRRSFARKAMPVLST